MLRNCKSYQFRMPKIELTKSTSRKHQPKKASAHNARKWDNIEAIGVMTRKILARSRQQVTNAVLE